MVPRPGAESYEVWPMQEFALAGDALQNEKEQGSRPGTIREKSAETLVQQASLCMKGMVAGGSSSGFAAAVAGSGSSVDRSGAV